MATPRSKKNNRSAHRVQRSTPPRTAMLQQASVRNPLALQRAIADPSQATPADILALQRTAGNRAVTQLIQAKLTVGPVGDTYEQEADQVADQVLRMPEGSRANGQISNSVQRQEPEEEEALQMMPAADTITPRVQRQEEEEELQMQPIADSITPRVQRQEEEEELQMQPEEEELQMQPEEEDELQAKPLVQRKDDGSFEAGGEFESRLASKRGGYELPKPTRDYMEPRFGADFGNVRVHTDNVAVQMNREIGAQAFTHGSDVFFGASKFNPDTTSGKRLLAHELTHVVQQTGGQVGGRQAQGKLARGPEGDKDERAADRVARLATGSAPSLKKTTGQVVQRLTIEERIRQLQQAGLPEAVSVAEARKAQQAAAPMYDHPIGPENQPPPMYDHPIGPENQPPPMYDHPIGPENQPPPRRPALPPPAPSLRQLEIAKGITTDESYGASDALGSGLGVVENATSISGLFGTEGKGNTGWVDVGPRLKDSFKGRADAQVSGVSDMLGGAAGYLGGGVGMYQGMKAFSDPEAGKVDKTAAALDIGSGAAGSFAGTQKAIAGGMDAFDAGGQSSIFGPGSGLPASSDVKYVGDWAGVGAGGLGFLAESVRGGKQFGEYVGDVRSGKYASKSKGGRGGWSHARAYGRGLRSAGRLGSAGVVTSREALKLVGQLQGGGDVANASAGLTGAVSGLTTAAGALGVATGGMEMAAGGYRGYKAYQRHKMLKKRAAAGGDEKQQAALQHLLEIQKKRGKSAGISGALGSLGVLSGALTLSGVGAIPGLAIGAATGLFSLGRWGFRKFKQKMRDKAAKREKEGKQKNRFLSMFNTAKSTEKKTARNLETARTLLEADDPELLRSVGLTPKELERPVDGRPPSENEKLKRIMKALQKR